VKYSIKNLNVQKVIYSRRFVPPHKCDNSRPGNISASPSVPEWTGRQAPPSFIFLVLLILSPKKGFLQSQLIVIFMQEKYYGWILAIFQTG
jgi:hypothetical protein